jgi:hypothetical protein
MLRSAVLRMGLSMRSRLGVRGVGASLTTTISAGHIGTDRQCNEQNGKQRDNLLHD